MTDQAILSSLTDIIRGAGIVLIASALLIGASWAIKGGRR